MEIPLSEKWHGVLYVRNFCHSKLFYVDNCEDGYIHAQVKHREIETSQARWTAFGLNICNKNFPVR